MITTVAQFSPTRSLRSARRRGFTLIEVMFASIIMIIVLGAISATFLGMLQVERKNGVVLGFATNCMELRRLLTRYAAAAQQIVSPDGRSVRITSRTGVVSLIRYEDDDNNPQTIKDNRIVFVPDVSMSNLGQLVVQYVSPPGLVNPIFTKDNTVGYSPLRIDFNVGDYTTDPKAKCHSVTGPGFQTYTFRMRVSPRNTL